MSTVRPPFKAIDDIREPGGGFREIGRVYLSEISQAHDFSAGASAGNQRSHLLGREILGLVDNEESVQEGPPAHKIKGPDLDTMLNQIVGSCSAPLTADLGSSENFQIVH